MKVRPLQLAALSLLLGTAACSAGTSVNSGGEAGPVVAAYANALSTLDPIHADYAATNHIISTVYDTLVAYDDKRNLVGSLAESFTLSPDATSIAVTLRSGVTFHDGTPLTADDVKYSLDRDKRLGVGIAGLLTGYSSTEVTDPTHLTIHLDGPNAEFPALLSRVYIVSAAAVSAHAGSDDGQAWLQTNDAGSGPFVTTGSPVSGDVVINRFDKYWNFDKQRPTRFTFRRIDQSSTQLAELQAGNVDVGLNLTAADAARVSGGNVDISYVEPAAQTYIVANVTSGPTANVTVRKALQLAFDYTGGQSKILAGHGSIATGILPALLPCRPNLPASHQDLAAAKKMLADAGLSNLTLTLRFQPTNSVQTQEATLFQSNLRDIGVTLNLEPIAYADYLSLLHDKANIPELMLLNDSAPVPSAGVMLFANYSSSATGTNKSGYSNPKVDALLSQARATSDAGARCDLYEQAQTLINDDAVTVNMYSVVYTVGSSKSLTGFTVSPTVTPVSLSNVRFG